MTVANAFKAFIFALTGQTPTGNTVAEVIQDGATKVAAATGVGDLTEITDAVSALTAAIEDLPTLTNAVADLVSGTVKYEDVSKKSFVLNSSTAESVKSFKVTVTDDGTLSATEIVAP